MIYDHCNIFDLEIGENKIKMLITWEQYWYNPNTDESLHPDFNNPSHKPHWDYKGPEGEARLNTDGTWEWK
ncbi:MAG: hypothetical protein WAM28_00420 [Chlamydiales bacterium]